ncbi:hypothetical protein ACW9HM_05120 [Nocardia gipuzkoensis]
MTAPREPSPVYLTISDDENELTVELRRTSKKLPIRVGVGSPGRQSGIWRIWSSNGKHDVYIAARNTMQIQKWSLHESGDWRYQWCTHSAAQDFAGTAERILDRWERPDEIAATGWTKGFSIFVRYEDVVDIPDHDGGAGVSWLPTPSEGHQIGMHLVIARPDRGFVGLGEMGLHLVDGFAMANNHVVLLLANELPIDEQANEALNAEVRRALSLMRADVPWSPGLRMMLYGGDQVGGRRVHDIALTRAAFDSRSDTGA